MHRKFDIAKAIGIEEKCRNHTNAIFEGGLRSCRSGGSEFRGHQETFGEYVESSQNAAAHRSEGPVDVDCKAPAVDQL